MFNHPYVMEKLMEVEKRRPTHIWAHELPPRARGANGLARSVGRAMRRTGERLEAWAEPGRGSQSLSDYFPEPRRY